MTKIPVNIISGFLGSGKTTAIIKLLSEKSSDELWAIVVNEFGKISIDGQTLRGGSGSREVFDISGGCICCSAKGYLLETLSSLESAGKYSRIIIEPSGLGGIDMVTEIVQSMPRLKLMPVVCMVDITSLENARLQIVPIYQAQIRKSDVIVFSKCDLLSDDVIPQLIEKFKLKFPDKQILQSNLNLALLDNMSLITNKLYENLRLEDKNLTDSDYFQKEFIFDANSVIDSAKFVQQLKQNTFIKRLKGFIHFDTGWCLFNYIPDAPTFQPCTAMDSTQIVVILEKSDAYDWRNFEIQKNLY